MADWSKIVEEHGPLVWRTAFRLLHCEADADDCSQRTFQSAMKLAGSQPVKNWPGMLVRLATARALDRLRQRRRQALRLSGLPDEPVVDGKAHDPFEDAAAEELAARLRQALAAIDPVEAQVFCLACLEDWSYHEIACQLDITVNHVGVLLSRARAVLRDRLQTFRPGPAPNQEPGYRA
jgi:RNA polymerase sigma-70 factor (ECF subfamily)